MAYLGLLFIAIALLIVAIYLSMLLTKSSKLLLTVTGTVKEVEAELDKSIEQLYGTLNETEQLATDVQVKLTAAAPLFSTIENIGRSSQYLSEEVNKRTKQFEEDGSLPGTEPFITAIQYGEFGSQLWNSWKRGKKSTKNT
ncbi:hypothetical protein SporoP37_01625 [Sporosarcina sp. P37]|uniref:DUF948 domain-containing protein n=1 Tax=unclassified Sporosarcina TaxID=2647733 RepID=UPI0009C060BE|nr:MULTISPECIES: DUF948 domain-containing protein [unclassified Sporosarcina]ARD46995.1 hypothetical protein SporoP33_01215 [Sporosarcina sp. P33]ARK23518.1 hypothetical protein SporoP37_01625 [Sporosarcina sp. P37]PID17674.1 DUF948 domain-containing protein [Sporosarcina sp. P35]